MITPMVEMLHATQETAVRLRHRLPCQQKTAWQQPRSQESAGFCRPLNPQVQAAEEVTNIFPRIPALFTAHNSCMIDIKNLYKKEVEKTHQLCGNLAA